MKYKIEDGYFMVYCNTHGWIELAFTIILGNGVHCILCKEHLGYTHDIPKKWRKINEI